MAFKKLGKIGQEIFDARYCYPGEEHWFERAKVIARVAASCETDEQKENQFIRFSDCIGAGDLVPGGRIIFGAGRSNQNFLNCYALQPLDNVNSIGKVIQDMYKISCGGGGIGFNFSEIRPKGDDIQNIKNSAPGSISNMKMINEIGNHVKAGKSRRTALLAILNITHPDLLEFLTVKLDRKELTNFNISVGITNRFIEAVENNEDWYFTFGTKRYDIFKLKVENEELKTERFVEVPALNPLDAIGRAGQHYKEHWRDSFTYVERLQIKAKDIWNKIIKNSVNCGEPGFFNIDLVNSYTNIYWTKMSQPNPCSEIPLEPYANCCLGHINLSHMVLEDGSDVNWRKLAHTIRVGIRFLDNILTVNHYPLEECKIVGQESRRIGLGTMGLHYMLIKLGLRYGSDKSLEFIGRLYETIRNEAYLTSCYLAEEKGSFPKYNYKQFLSTDFTRTLPARIRMVIKQRGMRNAVMLTAAPTGTVGMMMEISTGIEPIFAWAYKRRYRQANVWKEQVIVDPLFKQFYKENKDLSVFAGAYDITPEEHLKVQAEIQKYIDNSISKTINLPEGSKWEELSDTLLHYIPYLKGMTVYKANSRGMEPLEAIPLTQDNINKYMTDDIEEGIGEVACAIGDNSCGS